MVISSEASFYLERSTTIEDTDSKKYTIMKLVEYINYLMETGGTQKTVTEF